MKKILILGSSGFVGSYVTELALNRGLLVKALTHKNNVSKNDKNLEIIQGDILNQEDVNSACENVDAVINLVGIIKETNPNKTFENMHIHAVENIIRAMRINGVRRIIQTSALGVEKDSNTQYFNTKWKAERLIQDSGLDYTIFRPSIIWGKQGFSQEIKKISNIPIFSPIVGTGQYRFQPVRVEDIAKIYLDTLSSLYQSKFINKTFPIVGPQIYTFEDLIKKFEPRGKIHIHVPISLMKSLAHFFENIHFPFPITYDQILMLEKENFENNMDIYNLLDFKPLEIS